MTIQSICQLSDINPNSLYQKIKRKGFKKLDGKYYTKHDELPYKVLLALGIDKLEGVDGPTDGGIKSAYYFNGEDQPMIPAIHSLMDLKIKSPKPVVGNNILSGNHIKKKKKELVQVSNKGKNNVFGSWLIAFLKFAPLPMLGLAAAHGVYSFSTMFGSGLSGEIFAWITAAAFEATYIGLSLTQFKTPEQKHLAKKTALGAVAVSAIFNSLSGVYVYEQSWILSLVHGVPLALIGYLVAELRFQTNKSK